MRPTFVVGNPAPSVDQEEPSEERKTPRPHSAAKKRFVPPEEATTTLEKRPGRRLVQRGAPPVESVRW